MRLAEAKKGKSDLVTWVVHIGLPEVDGSRTGNQRPFQLIVSDSTAAQQEIHSIAPISANASTLLYATDRI